MVWENTFYDLLPAVVPDSLEETFLLSRGVSESQVLEYGLRVLYPGCFEVPAGAPLPFRKSYKKLQGDSYLVFPLTDIVGRIFGFQFRSPTTKEYITCLLDGYSPELFGYYQAIRKCNSSLVLVEGVFDLFPVARFGAPVVATLTAGVSPVVARSVARLFDHVWLLFDDDKTGKRASVQGAEVLRSHGLKVTLVNQKPGYKDTGDLWVAFGDIGVSSHLKSQGVEW